MSRREASGSFRQVVPRPAWARPGGPAPWAGPDTPAGVSAEDPSLSLEVVVRRLAGRLEPADDQLDPDVGAAVLLLLVGLANDTSVVLIRRSSNLSKHPGEIAFPGGRREPGELGLAAALREAEEEIGVAASQIDVLGRLQVISRPRAPATIVPYVAAARGLPTISPNPDEVDEVLFVPIRSLLREDVFWEELWNPEGHPPLAIPFFAAGDVLGDDLLWGASARMLTDLLVRIVAGAT